MRKATYEIPKHYHIYPKNKTAEEGVVIKLYKGRFDSLFLGIPIEKIKKWTGLDLNGKGEPIIGEGYFIHKILLNRASRKSNYFNQGLVNLTWI